MSCGSTFLYLQKKVAGSWFFAFIPARCKSWNCPICRPIKANIVRNYITENFTGDTLYMLTLTFFHSGSPLSTWEKLGKCWNLMRTFIVRNHGKFNYIRIVEPHKEGGWPHMHILVDRFIAFEDITKNITKWGFGWNLHNVHITSEDAAKYLSKYLSKPWPNASADILRIASKTRVVSVSRGMPAIFTSKGEWEVVQHSCPKEHASFMCNAIIGLLRDKGAGAIVCNPFADGFMIESDTMLPPHWLERRFDPYIWEYCQDYHFSYLPHGLQMRMF